MHTHATEQTVDRRRPQLNAIAAIVIAVMVIAVAAFVFRSNEASTADPAELSLGQSASLASCLVFEPEVLADMPVAFLGTATATGDDEVTLTVDRWYTVGEASAVRLIAEHESPALIAGFEFVPGAQYLIAASDGAVNYCGYSGPVSPELLAGYESAFTT